MNKYIYIGLAFLILLVLAFFMIKKVGKGKGAREESREVNQDLKDLNKNPKTKQGITDSQAAGFANKLFAAMDGYGSNADEINRVFASPSVRNDADVLAIIKEYKIREISSGRFNPEPNLKGTLTEALTSELSDGEMSALNSILTKKGIKYRF